MWSWANARSGVLPILVVFVNMGASRDEEYLKEMVNNYHIGAVRYNPATASEVYDQNKILNSTISYRHS